MANKQKMKTNEAKVIIFLENAETRIKNMPTMSLKLGIEYNYLARLLKGMVYKDWLTRTLSANRKYYYELTELGKTSSELAKEVLTKR